MMKKKITLMSFGFKYGPPNTNYYFDVSFAKNPAREERWSLFDEPDNEMVKYILEQESVQKFVDTAIPFINVLIDLDDDVRIGIGCNAGRHRSVVISTYLYEKLRRKDIEVCLIQRDHS